MTGARWPVPGMQEWSRHPTLDWRQLLPPIAPCPDPADLVTRPLNHWFAGTSAYQQGILETRRITVRHVHLPFCRNSNGGTEASMAPGCNSKGAPVASSASNACTSLLLPFRLRRRQAGQYSVRDGFPGETVTLSGAIVRHRQQRHMPAYTPFRRIPKGVPP